MDEDGERGGPDSDGGPGEPVKPAEPGGLSPDKRRRVLDAAIREFADRGFENASTNKIVKEAGISKGLLFHYFGSKKALYLKALDNCIERSLDYFKKNWHEGSPDPITRFFEWSALKVRMYREYPVIYQLGVLMMTDVPLDLKPEMEARYASVYQEMMPLYLGGLDMSVFRDDVTQREALDLILLVANTLVKQYLDRMASAADKGFSQVDAVMQELRRYLDLLKDGLYKRSPGR